jgi:ribonuclease T1
MKNTRNSSLVVIALILAAIFFRDQINLEQLLGGSTTTPTQTTQTPNTSTQTESPAQTQSSDDALVMRDVKIYDLDGNLAYEGDMDLAPVFDRIERGERDSHDNDGSSFGNREGLLPKKERGYYTEYVVRTPGLRGVGPQRLVLGENGEAYYTSDHYESFVQVR